MPTWENRMLGKTWKYVQVHDCDIAIWANKHLVHTGLLESAQNNESNILYAGASSIVAQAIATKSGVITRLIKAIRRSSPLTYRKQRMRKKCLGEFCLFIARKNIHSVE